MRSSESIENIAGALVLAHTDLTNPVKDSKADAGKFSYRFASLPSILDQVRPILVGVGIAVVQETVTTESGIGVTTRLTHSSGEWIEMGPLLMVRSNSPQENGSALSYARRYSLTAALALAADEDDDGVAAQRGSSGQGTAKTVPSRQADRDHSAGERHLDGPPAEGGASPDESFGGGEAPPYPDEPASGTQWQNLLRLSGGSTTKAVNRINKANGTSYTKATAQQGATVGELVKAMSL